MTRDEVERLGDRYKKAVRAAWHDLPDNLPTDERLAYLIIATREALDLDPWTLCRATSQACSVATNQPMMVLNAPQVIDPDDTGTRH